MIASGLDVHARAILSGELERRNGVLGSLPDASRAAVHEVAQGTIAALTKAILELAAAEPALAAALRSIYGGKSIVSPPAVPARSD
jgi:hypothetical protein